MGEALERNELPCASALHFSVHLRIWTANISNPASTRGFCPVDIRDSKFAEGKFISESNREFTVSVAKVNLPYTVTLLVY